MRCSMNHRPKTFPDQDQPPSCSLLQYTAVLGLPLDVPIAPVETHSCIGRTSGPTGAAGLASPLAGRIGRAQLECRVCEPLLHPASGFPPASPVWVCRFRSVVVPG